MAKAAVKGKKSTTVKKTTAKKAPVKKTTTATAKKAAATKVVKKVPAAAKKAANTSIKKTYKEAITKTELLATIADATELSKKEVKSVFEALEEVIAGHLNKRAIGQFTIPGLTKLVVQRKPATKARKGINPFNGEETIFKAKPARRIVKAKVLKKVKEMAE